MSWSLSVVSVGKTMEMHWLAHFCLYHEKGTDIILEYSLNCSTLSQQFNVHSKIQQIECNIDYRKALNLGHKIGNLPQLNIDTVVVLSNK